MRAVVLEQYGGPEVLVVRELPDPVPGPEEVVVDVVSSALNRADLAQRQGLYPSPPTPGGLGAYEIPGLEFAGRVAALGERARSWKVGRPGDGGRPVSAGFAERTVAHERMLLPVPSAVDPADAAAIPEAWITAWDALVAQGGLAAGGVALVHAGGSGVGTAAIQIARTIGARVVVTCSAGKVERCRELGADGRGRLSARRLRGGLPGGERGPRGRRRARRRRRRVHRAQPRRPRAAGPPCPGRRDGGGQDHLPADEAHGQAGPVHRDRAPRPDRSRTRSRSRRASVASSCRTSPTARVAPSSTGATHWPGSVRRRSTSPATRASARS